MDLSTFYFKLRTKPFKTLTAPYELCILHCMISLHFLCTHMCRKIGPIIWTAEASLVLYSEGFQSLTFLTFTLTFQTATTSQEYLINWNSNPLFPNFEQTGNLGFIEVDTIRFTIYVSAYTAEYTSGAYFSIRLNDYELIQTPFRATIDLTFHGYGCQRYSTSKRIVDYYSPNEICANYTEKFNFPC